MLNVDMFWLRKPEASPQKAVGCSPIVLYPCWGPVPVWRCWGPVPEVHQARCRPAWATACFTDGLRRGGCGQKNMAVPPYSPSTLMAWCFRDRVTRLYQTSLQRVCAEGDGVGWFGVGWFGLRHLTSPGMEPWQNSRLFVPPPLPASPHRMPQKECSFLSHCGSAPKLVPYADDSQRLSGK